MINRRTFMKRLLMLAGVLVSLPVRLSRAEALAIPLEKVDQLKTVGESVTLKIRGQEILFIRDTETTVRALDPTCTHRGCKVAFDKGTSRIECPCHKSAFDLDGQVLKGPASKGLKKYGAELKDQEIILSME